MHVTGVSYLACMSRSTSLLGLLLASNAAFPQQDQAAPKDTMPYIEELPVFPGGQEAMYDFLHRGVNYPDEALEAGISGKVWVQFVVRKDGVVDSVRTVRGVHPLLDAEAERVVRSMPVWKPGTMMGRPIAVRFNVPLVFSIVDTPAERKSARKARRVQRRE